MNSFLTFLLLALTLNCAVVRSKKFCDRLDAHMKKEGDKFAARGVPPLAGKKHLSIPGLKFIPTKDKYYLYIVDESDAAKAYVYDLDISCTADDNCPKIGDEKDLAQVFSGVTAFRNVYFQDGFTYFASGSQNILKYENTAKVGEIPENQFWNNMSHSTVYEWKDNLKIIKSRFLPPKSPKGPPLYAFSFDTFMGTTVEVQGNYDSVNIVKHQRLIGDPLNIYMTLYSFGDYLVPTEYYSHLPLPNGDDYFNFDYTPGYVRKDGANLMFYNRQALDRMFKCDTTPDLERANLNDSRSDNVYPAYFIKP